MAVTTAFPLSLQAEMPQGIHDFTDGADQFMLALIVAIPTGDYDEETTNYSELVANGDEVPNGTGYVTGGYAFDPTDNITPALHGTAATWQWSVDPEFDLATFSTSGCLIYNASKGNRAVYVGSFGGVFTLINQMLILHMPANGQVTALLRVRKA